MPNGSSDEREKTKKLFVILCLWYYLAGIEYGLIISSVNAYLQVLSAPTFYLGLALAAFPFSGLVMATFFGRLTDRKGKIRLTLLIGVSFSIVGNILYFTILDKDLVVAGRCLSGIGNSIDGALMGYAGLIKGPRKRASTFGMLLVTKQVGTIMVPFWQWLIKVFHRNLLSFHQIEATYGGFLALAWFIHFVLSFCLLQVEPSPKKKETDECNTELIKAEKEEKEVIASSWLPTFVNEQFIVAIIATFSTIFFQASMETMVTPFNRSYFGWTVDQIGLEFMMIGIFALIGYSLTVFASREVDREGVKQKRVQTRVTLLLGVIGCSLVSLLTALVISFAQFRATWLYCSIFASIIVFCICLPLGMVSSAATIAQNTPDNCQGSTQSVRFACEKTAQILAPLWVSSWGPAETKGLSGILIMFPSVLFFTFTSGALYSAWKFL